MDKPPIGDVLTYYGATHIPGVSGQRSMRCPFHGDDRTPSASIHFENDLFHCFTCGIGGDSIGLIMQREGLSFGDAVEFAERVFGGEYSKVRGVNGRKSRRRVFEDERPDAGQSSIFQSRVRRKPFAGA